MKNIDIKNKIYLIAIFLIASMYTLRAAYSWPFAFMGKVFLVMRLSAYMLLAIKMLLNIIFKKYTVKQFIFISIIGLFMCLISYQSKTIGYLVYYICIVAAIDVKYSEIIKTALISFVISSLLVVLLCYFGVIEDYIFQKSSRRRHGLGFGWTTHMPNLFMYIVLYIIYLRKNKINYVELAILFGINLFLFKLTNTKSAFMFTTLAIFITILLKNIKMLNQYNNIYKIVAYSIPLLLSTGIIVLSLIYNSDIGVLNYINNILSGRLALGHKGILDYGFALLARNIVFTGGDVAKGIDYNYVDSSYLQLLLNFGVVFYILLIVYILYFAKLINRKKDVYMLLPFILFISHSTFDPQLINMAFNYFFILTAYKNQDAIESS